MLVSPNFTHSLEFDGNSTFRILRTEDGYPLVEIPPHIMDLPDKDPDKASDVIKRFRWKTDTSFYFID